MKGESAFCVHKEKESLKSMAFLHNLSWHNYCDTVESFLPLISSRKTGIKLLSESLKIMLDIERKKIASEICGERNQSVCENNSPPPQISDVLYHISWRWPLIDFYWSTETITQEVTAHV
uniref:RIKEN cDNA 2010109A12 gene n=1 Tax=Mus spicilegus TaxID=10103 RepID=A0A8C6HPR9_MUSSI